MIVTFSSKVDADVLMMADHAKLVLKAAGKDVSGGIAQRGVFSAEQLDTAIANIERAIANEAPLPETDDDQEGKAPPVLLEQRAFPLLSMMRKAKAAQAPVMWETGSGW